MSEGHDHIQARASTALRFFPISSKYLGDENPFMKYVHEAQHSSPIQCFYKGHKAEKPEQQTDSWRSGY